MGCGHRKGNGRSPHSCNWPNGRVKATGLGVCALTQISTTVDVKVARNAKRFAVELALPLPENFDGTNGDARTLRQQLLAALDEQLNRAFSLYRDAVEFVKAKCGALTLDELASARVTPGIRTGTHRDTVAFYAPVRTKLINKGRYDLNSALQEIRRHIVRRVSEFLDQFVNAIAA